MTTKAPQRFFRMPLRFLRGSYVMSTLAVVALACGVALICALDLANRAVLDGFNRVVDTMAGKASLQLVAGGTGVFPEEVSQEVETISGVKLAVPVVSGTAFTTEAETLAVHGMDLGNASHIEVYEQRDPADEVPDALDVISRPDAILVTRAFANRYGLNIEDGVVLETPAGKTRFVVRGILAGHVLSRVFGGNLILMDIYAAQQAFTRPGFINRVDIVVDAGTEAAVHDELARRWPNLRIEEPARRKADIGRMVGALQFVLYAVGLLGLLAAFLVAFNRLATVFDLRTWQLGVLRAVGLRRETVWFELTKEGALLGLAGVALGLPLGIIVGRFAVGAISASTSILLNVVDPQPDLHVRAVSLVIAAILGMAAALLAAALPAWRTASIPVATIVGGRGIESESTPPRVFTLMRASVLSAILAALVLQRLTRSPAWGLVATLLIAVAAVMLARPLLAALVPAFGIPARRLTGPDARFATATLVHRPRRASLIVATLAVGLGSLVWLSTLIDSFERYLGEVLGGVVRADLVLTSARSGPNALEAPINANILDSLRQVAGIEGIVGSRPVDWHYADGPIAMETSDPEYFLDERFGRWPLLGPHIDDVWTEVAAGRAILVSSEWAFSFGTRVGDVIALDTPTGPIDLKVGGVTAGTYSPRGTIHISRELYRDRWGDDAVTRVLIRTAPRANLDEVQTAIYTRLGHKQSVRVLRAREWIDWVLQMAHQAVAPIEVLRLLIMLVVLFGMADTLVASVMERTREFGAVRAVGIRRFHLSRVVLLEGLLLSTAGLLGAFATGLALGSLWVNETYPRLLGRVLVFHMPYRQMATLVGLTLLVALVAGLFPARRAARLEPAAALRYE
jgi:putative ABC transport system permease protein